MEKNDRFNTPKDPWNIEKEEKKKTSFLPSFPFRGKTREEERRRCLFCGEVACRHRDDDSFIVSDERASERRREEKEEKEEENMW